MIFDFTDLKVSGSIGVEDVPLDVLLKIRSWLDDEQKKSNRTLLDDLAKSIVGASVLPSGGKVPEDKNPREAEPGVHEDEPETEDPHMRICTEAIKELANSGAAFGKTIRDIFMIVRANPEAYKWEYLNTSDWKKHWEPLEHANRVNIGVVMRALKRIIAHRPGYGSGGVYENFYELPVPVPTEKTVSETEASSAEDGVKEVADAGDALDVYVSEDKRKGEAVRRARNEAGFSIRELADLIGYDSSIIVNWETGVYKISPDAEDALKKLFGDNLFDNKEGEAE